MSNPNFTVRFFYTDEDYHPAKILGWDDFETIEADLYEDHLVQNNIPYKRENLVGKTNGGINASSRVN